MNSVQTECDSHARYVDDDGRETVVVCGLDRHAAPFEANVRHYDPNLDIYWAYADEEARFDDEERTGAD